MGFPTQSGLKYLRKVTMLTAAAGYVHGVVQWWSAYKKLLLKTLLSFYYLLF